MSLSRPSLGLVQCPKHISALGESMVIAWQSVDVAIEREPDIHIPCWKHIQNWQRPLFHHRQHIEIGLWIRICYIYRNRKVIKWGLWKPWENGMLLEYKSTNERVLSISFINSSVALNFVTTDEIQMRVECRRYSGILTPFCLNISSLVVQTILWHSGWNWTWRWSGSSMPMNAYAQLNSVWNPLWHLNYLSFGGGWVLDQCTSLLATGSRWPPLAFRDIIVNYIELQRGFQQN